MDFMTGLKRTMYCGEPRLADAGKEITVAGWVQRQRDLGRLHLLSCGIPVSGRDLSRAIG